jgi:alpha-mannosidase
MLLYGYGDGGGGPTYVLMQIKHMQQIIAFSLFNVFHVVRKLDSSPSNAVNNLMDYLQRS